MLGDERSIQTPFTSPAAERLANARSARFGKPWSLLRIRHRLYGIRAFNDELLRRSTGIERILDAGGANILGSVMCYGPLNIQNANPDYRNLRIGPNVSLGAGCLLDLAAVVEIQEDVTISMGCTILTHSSVGGRPLKDRVPDKHASVTIGEAAYLGANVTVLAGCDIGSRAIVGAGAVVTRPVPDDTTVGGVPARVLARG